MASSLPRIGIIGYGFVGKAVEHGFVHRCQIAISDPAYPQHRHATPAELARTCDFLFVCVPTPMTCIEGGDIDTAIIDAVMAEVAGAATAETPVVCVKSTVTPEVLKRWAETWPHLRLTMSPEYLTERNYLEDFIHMRSLVIGGKPRDTQALVDLFDQHSRCRKPYPIGQCDLIAAGVLKYMENAYLALKVTFMNQMYDVLKASGSRDEWNYVAEIFHLDPRMGTSHYQVPGPDGDRGWGGKCFPKDINALIHYCRRIGVDCDLMEKAWEINKRLRKDWDWAKIPGAVSAKKDKPANRRRTAGA